MDFCDWLGVRLTPAQRVLCRVAYDGLDPLAAETAQDLFGTTELPLVPSSIVGAVCGARAGKSYVLVALRLVHGMLVRDLRSMAPGQRAAALVIAPNDGLRREVVRYAAGAVMSKPELAQLLVAPPSVDTFAIRRPDGYLVEFIAGAAARGGVGGRGRSWTDFAMDECCFFRDSSNKINDEDIFTAGVSRVLPGGQTILASTPWGEAGLLYEFWRDHFRKPSSKYIIAHAPTLTLHDSEMTRSIVERERERDPENARREYEARFMTSGTTAFFEGGVVDAACTDEPFEVQPGDAIAAGADFGFRSDSSSVALVARRGDTFHVFDVREIRPEPGAPLRPSETVSSFADAIRGRCRYLMADQHYREAIAEHLHKHKLSYAPAPSRPADTYVRARMLLRDGRVRIHGVGPRDRLLRQMREVQGRPTSGGGMSITHPRWATGGHGDLVSALVLALWQVSGNDVPAVPPEMGTREWEEELREKRRVAWLEKRKSVQVLNAGTMNVRGAGHYWRGGR